jgi:glycosyltransferase involved in cell wall biosynthesis
MRNKPRLQVIAREHSGMVRDVEVVAEAAAGASWSVDKAWIPPRFPLHRRLARRLGLHKLHPRSFDLNVFIQAPETWWLPQARRSVVIPNADWFIDYHVGLIPQIDQMWCKTHEAVQIFRGVGARCAYLGFSSIDPAEVLAEAPPRNWREALHVAGTSTLKGSRQVIDAWRRHPHWPCLNLVTRLEPLCARASGTANIRVWGTRLQDQEIAALQLRCGVHVQPSETEGYGHVLGEAMAAGAALVTTDAPPMNELVSEERGWLVAARPASMITLARRYELDEARFDEVMAGIWDAPVALLEARGRAARQWYVENRQRFGHRLQELLAAVLCDSELAR